MELLYQMGCTLAQQEKFLESVTSRLMSTGLKPIQYILCTLVIRYDCRSHRSETFGLVLALHVPMGLIVDDRLTL